MTSTPPRRPVRMLAVLCVVVGALLGARQVWPIHWKTPRVVFEDFGGVYDDSRLEVCGGGHRDQGGLEREILLHLGMGPSDQDISQCVTINFVGPVRPGVYSLQGDGRFGTNPRAPPYWPADGHSVEVKSVSLTLLCFCGEFDKRATFTGTLELTQVKPPRGSLELVVTSGGDPVADIDVSLGRFKWSDAHDGY